MSSWKTDVEKKTGKKYTIFEAVKYKTQVVAGTNWYVVYKIGGTATIEVTIF
jgi:hypothetical protein